MSNDKQGVVQDDPRRAVYDAVRFIAAVNAPTGEEFMLSVGAKFCTGLSRNGDTVIVEWAKEAGGKTERWVKHVPWGGVQWARPKAAATAVAVRATG